jgi:hypothetical protein
MYHARGSRSMPHAAPKVLHQCWTADPNQSYTDAECTVPLRGSIYKGKSVYIVPVGLEGL